MPRVHRRTAPKVRDGQVRWKNNWSQTPSVRHTTQPHLTVHRSRPGPGHRHLLLQRDVERFVALIQDWNELSIGVDVILLDGKRTDCDGWYDRGVVAVCAWPREMHYPVDLNWFVAHARFLERIGLRTEWDGEDLIARWTEATAKAYQLLHVLLHELGHHHDRMTTRTQRTIARGEDYAEQYAWAYEEKVWERYVAEFGWPAA
jgi:hypothetical protein